MTLAAPVEALDAHQTDRPKARQASACPGRERPPPSHRLERRRIEQDLIAISLGISTPTLVRHYHAELCTGKAMMDGLAISALVAAMQRGGKEAVVAAKWWTQARMGWSEKRLVDDGRANVPVRVIVELVDDPAPVSAESTDRQTTLAAFDTGRHVQLVG